jgi:alkylated DNA repair dioxygenase AlkB
MTSTDTNTNVKTNDDKIQLLNDSWYKIYKLPDYLECTATNFESLLQLKPEIQGTIAPFGKEVTVPRFLATYGHNYKFSGSDHKSEPLNDAYLQSLLDYTNKIQSDFKYNGILVNWYMDGTQYIGPHSDDTTKLVSDAPIYSFSFGATRDFVIYHKLTKDKTVFTLTHNTVFIMGGQMQTYYTHTLPKRLKCKDVRINVTIRTFKE